MQGRTNAGGTGGFGLNLKIVNGTTMPSNPRENTVWVETTVTIKSYALSYVQPENASEGLLWLKTSHLDSGVEVDVGKKNAVKLNLSSGMLYTGGKWTSVNAWVYINSAWKQFSMAFDGRLYDNGDQCTDVTGGWGATGYKRVTSSGQVVEAYAGTLKSDCMYVNSNGKIQMFGTANPILLDGLKTLTVDWKVLGCYKDASTALRLEIQREKKHGSTVAIATLSSGKTVKRLTSTLDISDLSGYAYIVVGVTVSADGSSGNIYSIKAS